MSGFLRVAGLKSKSLETWGLEHPAESQACKVTWAFLVVDSPPSQSKLRTLKTASALLPITIAVGRSPVTSFNLPLQVALLKTRAQAFAERL